VRLVDRDHERLQRPIECQLWHGRDQGQIFIEILESEIRTAV
jgi:hypothetical protein